MITIVCPHCNEVITLKSITISDIDDFPIVLGESDQPSEDVNEILDIESPAQADDLEEPAPTL